MSASPTKDGFTQAEGPHTLKSDLGLAAFLGVLAAFARGIHFDHLHDGTIVMHPYYVGFYLASYQDGFRRRALAGTIARLLSPHGLNVLWLNLFALVVLSAILTIGVSAFVKLGSKSTRLSRIFAFAFCAGPVIAVLVEIIGDTLQLAFLGLIAVVFLCARSIESRPLRLVLGLGSLVLGFFIHEASIFFIAPCVPFLMYRWPRARHFVLPGLVALGCFLLAMHWSNLTPHRTYPVILFHFNGPLSEDVATPGFRALLHLEHDLYFGNRRAEASFVMKCAKLLAVVFVSLVALANCLSLQTLKRVLFTLACMAPFFLPLWCVAHDWGRFFAYSLYLAMVITAFMRHEDESEPEMKLARIIQRFCLWLEAVASLEFVQMASIFLMLVCVTYDNFEKIMLTPEFAGFVLILLAGYVFSRTKSTQEYAG